MSAFVAAVTAWFFSSSIASASLGGAVFSSFFLTMLALTPLVAFLLRGWKIKKEDVFSSFTNRAKYLYLRTYLKRDGVTEVNAEDEFEELYSKRYGWWRFIFPLFLFCLNCFGLMLLFSWIAIFQFNLVWGGSGTSIGAIVVAAGIAGGYLWVVAKFIALSRQYNLSPADVMNGTLRLAMSAAIGYAVSSLVPSAVGPFIAFAVGAFPLPKVNVILRRLSAKLLQTEIDPDDIAGQITKLDGIDALTADRLHDAGITTVPQLAYCDPVQLCMRTGLAFDFISDISAEALAWNYLGENLKALKVCGLRTSGEIRNLYNDVAPALEDAAEKREAAAEAVCEALTDSKHDAVVRTTLKTAADALGETFDAVLNSTGNDAHQAATCKKLKASVEELRKAVIDKRPKDNVNVLQRIVARVPVRATADARHQAASDAEFDAIVRALLKAPAEAEFKKADEAERDAIAKAKQNAVKDPTFKAAADRIDLAPELFFNVCGEIAGDPYTKFLSELWSQH